jgi:tetratricopeptide (TPR) repeat protein
MGVVYKARQLSLNRLVALKMIRGGARAADEVLNRFVEEARLIASLQHPNIVQIYEVSLQQDLPYFSMELVEGGSLADRIGGRPQSSRQAAQLVAILARAIHLAHQNGIIHRDLKPANILLSRPESRHSHLGDLSLDLGDLPPEGGLGRPKITDFGLAKQVEGSSGQTESGMIMGTPSYMAPEQAEGRSRAVGPAADVYALGAILYELLTGRPPYAAESPMETVLQLFQMEPVSPSRLQPRTPRDLETICLKCLQREPHKRYETAEALAEDLERFLTGKSILARPTPLPEQAWKCIKRRPTLATLLAALAASLLGLLGMNLWHQSDLRARLLQARLDERQARADEQAAGAQARLAGQRDKVKELLGAGEKALAARDYRNAQTQLLRARDQAGDEPALAALRADVERLLQQTDRQRRDRERLEQFQQRRNDALFHASLFTGGDLASALAETRTAAREALALFDVRPGADTPPAVDSPYYPEQERTAIVAACYELLLVLAETQAEPLPKQTTTDQHRQAEQALRLVDQADRLGLATQASHLRRAHYLAQAGDRAQAEEERKRAAALKPAGALDHFLIGAEHYRQGRWDRAVRAFEDALQAQPDHFWSHYYLALCRLKTHQPQQAVAGLTTCLAWHRDMPWLYLLRGSAWAELDQFDRAEADFAAILHTTLPESARYGLYINRGVLRIRQDRSADAIADLRQAIALKPGLYQGYVNLAQAYLKIGQPDKAVHELDEAIRRESGLAALYRTRARIHLVCRNTDAALADLEKAIRLDVGTRSEAVADDCLERGRLLHRRKDFAAALEAYDLAVLLRPRHARTHRLRAEALLELNRLTEALRSLDACLQYGSPETEVFQARAAVRSRLGQYAGAQTDYTRALEISPDAATYAARGWIYLVAEAPALALTDFQEAIRRAPNLGDAYNGRGYARILLGQYRQAVSDADEAVRRGPASPRLFYNAARVYAQAVARLNAAPSPDVWTASMLRTSWEGQAVGLLRKALDRQSRTEQARFWHMYIEADRALSPLHRTDGFRLLADRYLPEGG